MSEIYKIIISFIVFILWSFGMFGFGYLLSNQRATEQLNKANRQLADEQQKYASLVEQITMFVLAQKKQSFMCLLQMAIFI